MVHIRILVLGIVLQFVGYNPYVFTSQGLLRESAAAALSGECTQLSVWFHSICDGIYDEAERLIATDEFYREKLWEILLLAKNAELAQGIYKALLLFPENSITFDHLYSVIKNDNSVLFFCLLKISIEHSDTRRISWRQSNVDGTTGKHFIQYLLDMQSGCLFTGTEVLDAHACKRDRTMVITSAVRSVYEYIEMYTKYMVDAEISMIVDQDIEAFKLSNNLLKQYLNNQPRLGVWFYFDGVKRISAITHFMNRSDAFTQWCDTFAVNKKTVERIFDQLHECIAWSDRLLCQSNDLGVETKERFRGTNINMSALKANYALSRAQFLNTILRYLNEIALWQITVKRSKLGCNDSAVLEASQADYIHYFKKYDALWHMIITHAADEEYSELFWNFILSLKNLDQSELIRYLLHIYPKQKITFASVGEIVKHDNTIVYDIFLDMHNSVELGKFTIKNIALLEYLYTIKDIPPLQVYDYIAPLLDVCSDQFSTLVLTACSEQRFHSITQYFLRIKTMHKKLLEDIQRQRDGGVEGLDFCQQKVERVDMWIKDIDCKRQKKEQEALAEVQRRADEEVARKKQWEADRQQNIENLRKQREILRLKEEKEALIAQQKQKEEKVSKVVQAALDVEKRALEAKMAAYKQQVEKEQQKRSEAVIEEAKRLAVEREERERKKMIADEQKALIAKADLEARRAACKDRLREAVTLFKEKREAFSLEVEQIERIKKELLCMAVQSEIVAEARARLVAEEQAERAKMIGQSIDAQRIARFQVEEKRLKAELERRRLEAIEVEKATEVRCHNMALLFGDRSFLFKE